MPAEEISGTVEDPSGNPVGGATVYAIPHDESLDPLTTETDSNGAFVIDGALHDGENDYHIVASATIDGHVYRAKVDFPFVTADPEPEPEINWIDDFSHGSLSAFYDAAGDSSITNWTTQSTYVLEGDYALARLDSSGNPIYSDPADGHDLDNYPARGDYIKLAWMPREWNQNRASLMFAWDGHENGAAGSGVTAYQINFGVYASDDNTQIVKKDNDYGTVLAEGTFDRGTHLVGEWIEMHVDFGYSNNDVIEVTVFDENGNQDVQISATDTSYNDGAYGWYDLSPTSDDMFPIDAVHINNEDQGTFVT